MGKALRMYASSLDIWDRVSERSMYYVLDRPNGCFAIIKHFLSPLRSVPKKFPVA